MSILKRIILIFTFICFLLVCACATLPENIPPSYVSHIGYMRYDCEQLAEEQDRLVVALSAACDAQRTARSNDTAGVILLGLPVSSLSGSNQASNIARLKGELEAVHKAIIEKKCGAEIIPIDEVIKKKEKKKK